MGIISAFLGDSKMNNDIQAGSGNIYQDIGRPDSEGMHVKATLALEIAEIIKSRNLTQSEAGMIVGMPQPKLSAMLRGQFRGIGAAKMLQCLNRLGRDVDIVVRKSSSPHGAGTTTVVVN